MLLTCDCCRDPHGVATRRDKVLAIFMIVLALASSSVAIYSDLSLQNRKTA